MSVSTIERIARRAVGGDPCATARRVWRCERGATAIEYALMASLLAVSAIVGIRSFGSEMTTMFSTLSRTVLER